MVGARAVLELGLKYSSDKGIILCLIQRLSFVVTKQQSVYPLLKHIHINKCSFKERLPISSYFQQIKKKKISDKSHSEGI